MSKLKFELLFCLAFLTLSTSAFAYGPFEEYSKVIVKEFPISLDGDVILKNKYGKVQVDTWDQSAVQMKVEIIVNAGNEEKAEVIFKHINIHFNGEPDVVRCTTEVENVNTSFWDWITGSGVGSADFSINYTVLIPSSINLTLSNKYGDSFVHDLAGSANYEIKYGNLNTSCNRSAVSLNLGYGKAKIEGASNMHAEIKYATLKCESADQISINSKYSTVYIKECDQIISQTKYDDYTIGKVRHFVNDGKYDDITIEEVHEIEMNTAFADLQIGSLKNSADLNFKYGEVDIDHVNESFQNIAMSGNFADYEINIAGVGDCDLDVEGSYTDFDSDFELSVIQEEENSSNYSIKAFVGQKGVGGDITARLTHGSVRLR